MDEHTLLNEYAIIKRQQLESSPYSCLDTDRIDLNPHQIEALMFAVEALKLGGAILADEVGLGKTIEGFTYAPQGEFHGHSSENRFIHVTMEFVNTKYVQSLMKNLGERQSLLVYCKRMQGDMNLPVNVEVRRIPKDLLSKCSFEGGQF